MAEPQTSESLQHLLEISRQICICWTPYAARLMRISLFWARRRPKNLGLAKSLLFLCLCHYVPSTPFAAKSQVKRVVEEKEVDASGVFTRRNGCKLQLRSFNDRSRSPRHGRRERGIQQYDLRSPTMESTDYSPAVTDVQHGHG